MPSQPEILLILEAESLVNPIWVGKEDEQWGMPTQVGLITPTNKYIMRHQFLNCFILYYGSMMQKTTRPTNFSSIYSSAFLWVL